MKRYKRLYTEEDTNNSEPDRQITKIIKILRDENFGSELQRKRMINLLTTLHDSSDKRARRLFKVIGDYLTEVGDILMISSKLSVIASSFNSFSFNLEM